MVSPHCSSLMKLPLFPTSNYHHSNKLPLSLLSLLSPPTAAKPASPYSATSRRRSKCENDDHLYHPHQQKIVVIMGPTGSGKSRLSINLAMRFFQSEIINADKIQVYRGLDITTNKLPMRLRHGVPHHLLGKIDHRREMTSSAFRSAAAAAISSIAFRGNLPIVVGGSNSFIHALAAKRFDPDSDVFNGSDPDPVSTELRYSCCFIWVDVSLAVLNEYLCKRVDDMLEEGMFGELAEYFDSDGFGESDSVTRTGLRKAIGVLEFESYFRRFVYGGDPSGDSVRRGVYEEAVKSIKDNTCQLAKRQADKILRLGSAGWDLSRVDATEAFTAVGGGTDSGRSLEVWERQVVEPSVKIVKRFLEE